MHTSRAPNLLLKIFPPRRWRDFHFFYNQNLVVDWNPARAFSVDIRFNFESSANVSVYLQIVVSVSELVVHCILNSDRHSASANWMMAFFWFILGFHSIHCISNCSWIYCHFMNIFISHWISLTIVAGRCIIATNLDFFEWRYEGLNLMIQLIFASINITFSCFVERLWVII